jgi:hypothetical protein
MSSLDSLGPVAPIELDAEHVSRCRVAVVH